MTVSRRHAEFRLDGNEFQVVDVGSLNGTYVNREPVDSATLTNGDEVQIGKFRLVFLTGPKPAGDEGGPEASDRPRYPALAGMSIGAVLDLLRPDFPDVTISKIRFLEAEGLVTPQRSGSGYRRFTAYDCARLRFILTAQRDQYLPLKVIKAQLDAQPDGELPSAGSLIRCHVWCRAPASPTPEPASPRRWCG